jgi:hypothetical protein
MRFSLFYGILEQVIKIYKKKLLVYLVFCFFSAFFHPETCLLCASLHTFPALKEVLKMLSRFLQKTGELTKKTLEGAAHEALEKELFPTMMPRIVIDVNGNNIMIIQFLIQVLLIK